MAKVFISHSSADRKFVEDELNPFLKNHGIDTWYSGDDIPAAAEWERQLRTGLSDCDWILVVISTNSIQSEWVRTEVHWGLQNRKGRVVPLLLETCNITELHLGLLRVQHIDFRVEGTHGKSALLGLLGSAQGQDPWTTTAHSIISAQATLQEVPVATELTLEAEAGPLQGQTFTISLIDTCVIGRDAKTADFRLKDLRVSRMHARLQIKGNSESREVWVEDLHSSNGCFVNGNRLIMPHQLAVGDTLTLGESTLRLKDIH